METVNGWSNIDTYMAWILLSNDAVLYPMMVNAESPRDLEKMFPKFSGANWEEIFDSLHFGK